jgi:hypothetical protein
MWRVREIAMRRQQVRDAADLAPAHRVGLAGERERARSRAGRSCRSPACSAMSAAPLCVPWCDWLSPWHHSDIAAVSFARTSARRGRCPPPARRRPAAAMAGVTSRTRRAAPRTRVCARMKRGRQPSQSSTWSIALNSQMSVPGRIGEVQVGEHCRGVGAARVDDDDLHVRVGALRVLDAAEGDRVREGGVAAGDQEGQSVWSMSS